MREYLSRGELKLAVLVGVGFAVFALLLLAAAMEHRGWSP